MEFMEILYKIRLTQQDHAKIDAIFSNLVLEQNHKQFFESIRFLTRIDPRKTNTTHDWCVEKYNQYMMQYLNACTEKWVQVKILTVLYKHDEIIRTELLQALRTNRKFMNLEYNDLIEIIQANDRSLPIDIGTTTRIRYKDKQNVHNTDLNSCMKSNLEIIFTLKPIKDADEKFLTFHVNVRYGVRKTLERIYYDIHRFTLNSGNELTLCCVFSRVVNYIETHSNRDELYKRLLEELTESENMCWTGCMSRLVNTLVGFHPLIKMYFEYPYKEIVNQTLSELLTEEQTLLIGSGKLKEYFEANEDKLLVRVYKNKQEAINYLYTLA